MTTAHTHPPQPQHQHQHPPRLVPEPTPPAPPATTPRPPVGMWDIESAHPLRWALIYGLTVVSSLLASHCAAGGFQ